MMSKFVIFLFVMLNTGNLLWAQETQNKPCNLPQAAQFDFWLGEWELTWNDTVKGSNIVSKDLDGCVIHEQFTGPSDGFSGQSWSVYNPATNKWQQTWVDNAGAYLTLEGEFTNGQMELSTQKINAKGETVLLKMVFSNITPNEFDWEWKRSANGGSNFEVLWKIHYRRKQHPPEVNDAYMSAEIAKMKTYTLLLLKSGPNRGNYTDDELNNLQAGHLKHIFEMKLSGKLSIVGPLLSNGNLRGIGIFNASEEEVTQLMAEDPSVKAGLLTVETHPWFGLPGDALPE